MPTLDATPTVPLARGGASFHSEPQEAKSGRHPGLPRPEDETEGYTLRAGQTDGAGEAAEASVETDPWIGRTLLGQFRILQKLGEGGFGATYVAEQQQLTGVSKAVVKFIREDLPAQHREMVVKRFLREVATLEKLDNHHLPRLLGSGRQEGQLFLVMQNAGDLTLSELLRREKRLEPGRALDIAAQVCEALGEAHRWHVVHRDVKPDNILVTVLPGEDRVKLIDVGIAKILGASEIEDPNSQLSHARLVIGTPAYMSPEQALGSDEIDGRSDLYSLACVLYELLTGERAARGATNQELMRAHLSGDVPALKTAGLSLPPFFQALLSKGLARNPSERFESAAAMRSALLDARVRWSRESGPEDQHRTRWWRAGAGLAVAAAATLTFLNRGGATWPRPPVPPQMEQGRADKTGPLPAPPDFVRFSGGTFQQGRMHRGDGTNAPDVPSHEATVGPFALAREKVRRSEYAPFARANGLPAPQTGADDLPAVGVSRGDAGRYCAGRFQGGGRLPAEEEWEWAARGGGGRLFPYGDEFRSDCVNAMQGAGGKLEPVDARPCGATPEGIVGMTGNAWEWTASDASVYPGSRFKLRPGLAVIRGGSFYQERTEEVTATHRWFVPSEGNPTISFRCAFGSPR